MSASVVIALGAMLVTAQAHAQADARPCGGFYFANGEIVLSQPVPSDLALSDATKACLGAIASAVKERPYIRAVTVAARLPSEQRRSGEALKLAKAISAELTSAGLRARMVSAVAPAIGHGQSPGVYMAYRERRSTRVVARVRTANGEVLSGRDLDALKPADPGSNLFVHHFVKTGANSNAFIALADGSALRLGPSSVVRVGRIALTRDLKRQVRINLAQGEVHTIATVGGPGTMFQIVTRTAVAGVRGTSFRTTSAPTTGDTRLETITGGVQLDNTASQGVLVSGGHGSRIESTNQPEKPRLLLDPAQIISPRSGGFNAPPTLTWQAVDSAAGYRIEVAREAGFARELFYLHSATTSVKIQRKLHKGKWFWRVSAIDPDGFIGMPSKIYAFELM